MKTGLILAALALLGGTAHGEVFVLSTHLSGAAESPSNSSPGTGTAIVRYDSDNHELTVKTTFSGLEGTVTAAHIHAPADPVTTVAGVATQLPTFVGFPFGVTEGTYENTFDLLAPSSWNPAFITANGGTLISAEQALADSLIAGTAYLNIHSTIYPGGEIRGFLVPDFDADLVPDDVDVVPQSDLRSTIFIEDCDTGVPNSFSSEGVTLADVVQSVVTNAANRGDVSKLINEWRRSDVISGGQANDIRRCAGKAF